MKVAVIKTPGSNCDQDAFFGLRDFLGIPAEYVWHDSASLDGFEGVVLPGGFTYGDYLRGGAIAARSKIMPEVIRFANEGKPVIGICNGFQILTELGLLPGALVRNECQRFVCREVHIVRVNQDSIWTRSCAEPLAIPIAHNEGRYVASDATLRALEDTDRIAFAYCTPKGVISPEANPNGSTNSIAGVLNERGNVLGLMPHPERALSDLLGGADGRCILGCFAGA